ncbi:MAG: AAA family ATPase [Pseudomonadota bacterium]
MTTAKTFTYHRPVLADNYCQSLEGQGLTDSRSGLFLAAPRRTGKSTFLRADLLPAMQARGWTSIYVDLWADKAKDPAVLITSAIKTKIGNFASVIKKLVKAARVEKINVLGALSLNLDSPELPKELTLTDALEALVTAGNAPVAIVIDEAQHALSTSTGIDAMFALKAARDHLNQGREQQQLFIVLTGSNRDKLAHLVLKRTQPFFGSQVTRFPLLGKDFTDAYTDFINPQLATSNQFSHEDMFAAFKLVGHRPEMLRNIVGEIALNAGAGQLGEELKHGAEALKERIWSAMESEFAELPDTQRAVLETLIAQGKNYLPFSETSMRAYANLLQQEKVSTPAVQGALDALREKGLVWRAAYGDYALEDESLTSWYKARVDRT